MSVLKAALGIAATAMVKNTVVKPRQVGAAARAYCDRVGKPLLLVMEPTLVSKLMGPPVKADVTMTRAAHVPVSDKAFGAVLAIGVLERQRRPDLVLEEWRRIADTVFAVVPPWWSPLTWLNPSNRWYIEPSLKRVAPLWTDRRHMYLLRVSDNGYGRRAWTPTTPNSTRPQNPTLSRPGSNGPQGPRPSPPDTSSLPVPDLRSGLPGASEQPSSATHLVTVEGDLPDLDDLESLSFGS